MTNPEITAVLVAPTPDASAKAEWTASFEQLKQTARSVDDVASWFKHHPALVPGLPPELYAHVDVEFFPFDNWRDWKRKTVIDEYELRYSVSQRSPASGLALFEEVTALTPVAVTVAGDTADTYLFHARYKVQFDALDWRFVAVDGLAYLCALGLTEKSRAALGKNLYTTHFPERSWDELLTLYNAALLPDATTELRATLWDWDQPRTDGVATLPENVTH